MTELLSICVLILIACVGFLFWYIQKLHDLITKCLKLISNNANLINRVSDVAFNTDSEMLDIWKRHLEVHHGAIFEESLKDKE